MFFLQYFVFKLLPKFKDLINSDDCIGKITLKSIRLYPVFIKKKDLNLIRKGITCSGKMRNSGNYNYDYVHSYLGKYF